MGGSLTPVFDIYIYVYMYYTYVRRHRVLLRGDGTGIRHLLLRGETIDWTHSCPGDIRFYLNDNYDNDDIVIFIGHSLYYYIRLGTYHVGSASRDIKRYCILSYLQYYTSYDIKFVAMQRRCGDSPRGIF